MVSIFVLELRSAFSFLEPIWFEGGFVMDAPFPTVFVSFMTETCTRGETVAVTFGNIGVNTTPPTATIPQNSGILKSLAFDNP